MSGWLLLAALLIAAVVGWLIYLDRRAARLRRAAPNTPARARVTRLQTPRDVTDTEFSSEVFLPPEMSAQAAEGQPRAPWGKVAVPAWEHPLPWSYGETRLTLLVRDPYWLFAYWELTDEGRSAAEGLVGREAWAGARPVLRVHDTSTGTAYDVAVNEEARNWYLNVGQPDRTWYAEIGRLTEGGRFVMMARSNTVHTPRDGPSDVIDPRWPPLGRGAWPGGLPASPGMAAPASPGMPGSMRGHSHESMLGHVHGSAGHGGAERTMSHGD